MIIDSTFAYASKTEKMCISLRTCFFLDYEILSKSKYIYISRNLCSMIAKSYFMYSTSNLEKSYLHSLKISLKMGT